MEGLLIVVGLLFVLAVPIALLVLPIVLLGQLGHVRTRLDAVERDTARDLARLQREVWALRRELDARASRQGGAPSGDASAVPSEASWPAAATPGTSAAAASDPEPPTASPSADPLPVDVVPAPAAPVPSRGEEPPPVALPREDLPPVAPPPAEPPPVAAAPTLEEQIGLVWFTRIGAGVLLLGVAYFFKYAVDNAWVGPLGRVVAGAVAGLVVLGLSEASRARSKALFSDALAGVGLACLGFAAYASHAFYQLVPAPAAIGAIALVSTLGGTLAVRHRSELVLVASTASALAAPALLSSGRDRPLALFSYALVVCALSLTASHRARLRVAPWVAVGGYTLLFFGWAARYLDVHPPVAGRDFFEPAGPYFPLASRVVPLSAVALGAGEWLALALVARRRSPAARGPLVLSLASVAFAGVASATLLHDRAEWAVASAIVVGGVASLVALRERTSAPLLVSLCASTLCFGASIRSGAAPVATLVALAAWAGLNAAALLRSAGRTSALRGVATALVALVFTLASAATLLEHHPRAFLTVLVVTSGALVALSRDAAAPWLSLVAALVTAPFVFAAAPSASSADGVFLALAAAWALVHGGGAAFGVLARREAPSAIGVLVTAASGLVFAAVALTHPLGDLPRAAALVATGAGELAIGVLVLRRASRRFATVLLGVALALFAVAAGVLFSGVTVTLVWAGIAAVVAVLAARDDDRVWLAAAWLLFALVTARVLLVDVQAPERARDLWLTTSGQQGRLTWAPLTSPRALALLGVVAALVVSGRACRRASSAAARTSATLMVLGAHLAGLVLVLGEARALALTLPDVSAIPSDERLFAVEAAIAAQAGKLGVVTTLALGGWAALVLAGGFAARSKPSRYLGLALFALALAKLATWDVWHLPRVLQIGALVGTGALLLAASFLYARFGRRLVALLRTGAAGAAFLALSLPSPAEAAPPASAFTHAASLDLGAVDGELVSLPVGLSWLRASSGAPLLADLRVVDPSGADVPYLLRDPARAAREAPRRSLPMTDPVALPDGAFRATFEPGSAPHDHLDLELSGDDFVRVVRVESSDDRRDWGVLTEGPRVFRLSGAEGQASSSRVRFPTSSARWLRVTLLPKGRGDASIAGASTATAVAAASEPDVLVVPASIRVERDAAARRTDVVLDVGEPGAPLSGVRLDVSTPSFERAVSLSTSADGRAWSRVGRGLVFRGAPGDALTEALRVPLSSAPRSRYLRVTIEDGDDAPLALRGASVEVPRLALILRRPAARSLTVLVGSPSLSAPTYDLAATLPRAARPAEGPLVEVTPNPAHAPPAPPLAPFSERHRAPLIALLVIVLGALAAWTARLLLVHRPD